MVVDLIHDDQRQQYGGNAGVLSDGGVEAAIALARNRFAYENGDVFACAAAYIFGLAKNHGYQDANKRTAFATGLTFLRVNHIRVVSDPKDAVQLMLDVDTDIADEPAIAAWLRADIVS